MGNLLTYDEFLLHEKLEKDFFKKVIFLRFGSSIKGLTGHDDKRSAAINQAAYDDLFITFHSDDDIKKENLDVDTSLPVIYYGGTADTALDFLKKYKIKKSNLYNKPEFIVLSGDKKKFHETFKDIGFLPKTVFSKEDAVNYLTFPIIAKPGKGHSGIGIQKFESRKDLQKSKEDYDVYSEFINSKKEFRILFLKDKILHVDERVTNFKTKKDISRKKKDESLDFVYVKQDMGKVPFLLKAKEIARTIREKIPLEVFSLDVILDENDKLFVLETNSATGIGAHKLVTYYIAVYEDFFGESIPKWFADSIKTKHSVPSLLLNYPKYKKEIESSEWAIDYKDLLKNKTI